MADVARFGAAAVLLAVAFAAAFAYPLAPAVLAAALAIHCAVLWRWPWLWLVVIPAIVPNLDLAPWTGWLLIQEPDLFVLASLAVLLVRVRPARVDVLPGGIGGLVLAVFVAAMLIGAGIGLSVPDAFGGSSIVYLTQDNTLRTMKPFVLALALLPFLRARQRTHGDALFLFGWGMLLGLAGVVALVALERSIFVALWDFRSDYRVSAAFGSMHVGGGHIGAWLAMALPFLAVPFLRGRARWWPFALLLAAGGGYALVVTFARTAYVAALAAIAVTASVLALGGFRGSRAFLRVVLVPATVFGGLAVAVLGAAGSVYMSQRIAGVGADLSTREANWVAGLSVRDHGPLAITLGSGLGTYPRLWFDRAPPGAGPTNIRAGRDGAATFVTLAGNQPLYFVQKVAAVPGQPLRLAFRARAHAAGGQIGAGLCEKWLLYSYNCATARHQASTPGGWEEVALPLLLPARPDRPALPLELYLSVAPGTRIDITAVRLLDAAGDNLLSNGDFRQGTTLWFFTDDNHVLWRIFNQYLMTFFEGGLLGVAALLLLLTTALLACLRALSRGERLAAPLAGALAAFAVSAMFDAVLEAPRLAFLVYLIAFTALGLWWGAVPDSVTQGVGQLGQLGQPSHAGEKRVTSGNTTRRRREIQE